jgi:DNA-directed RNA polymerase subunit RPC12/RpoP
MSQRLPITCTECGKSFREPFGRIRAESTVACPTCPNKIKIDPKSDNDTVRKALSMARKLRLQAAQDNR